MTLAERAQLATQVRQRKAAKRASLVRQMIAEGECVKRAAYRAGVSYRTACRYSGAIRAGD